ncbi:MAG TPA: metal-dependent transcriptional regulator [Candidatus Eubacterium faecipullorum]|uniref:Metal-dependent transcriptional regulator n=1 Tax=Candidatus Eubacterium faecipullorum TaxID=2838571 RepID=A0A9D1RCV1_9FIRM|nr:metal-dependent transcriptional regulator [Candidatus Eubacterium faecipullorum]
MQIKESAENYLETILVIHYEKGYCRCIDISNKMGFSKPSVSVYMKNLREDGYIHMDNNGDITLTDKGREIAEKIYERHNVIAGFLMQLGTPEDIAFQDSCKIEHDISEESFRLIKAQYYKNKEQNQ